MATTTTISLPKHPDDAAFGVLVKAAVTHIEPGISRALVAAWKAAQQSVSLTEFRLNCREKNWAGAAKALLRGKVRQRQDEILRPALAAAFLVGVKHGSRPLRRLGVQVVRRDLSELDLKELDPYALQWAQTRAGELVDATDEVKARIQDIIEQAVDDGLTVDEAAELIQQSIGLDARRQRALENYAAQVRDTMDAETFTSAMADAAEVSLVARAMMIARTEIMMATNAGQMALWNAARDEGVLDTSLQRIWIVTDDAACCDECQALADDGPVDFGDTFADGTDFPPLHPNCRCTLGLVNADGDVVSDDEDMGEEED